MLTLVGPTGSGKSTIIKTIVEDIGADEVSSASSFPSRAGLYVSAAGDIFMTPQKMGWKFIDWPKKWLQYYSASRHLRLMSERPLGVHLVDEGPIHKLVSKKMLDEEMKGHWESYCKKVIADIVSCDHPIIMVIKVNTDLSVRFERRKKRGRSRDAELKNAGSWEEFKSASSERPSLGTMEHLVISQLKERLGGAFVYHEVDGARNLSDVSSEVVSCFANIVAKKKP